MRPFTYQQREGYLINNPGGPLTKVLSLGFPVWEFPGSIQGVLTPLKDQIEDLQSLSQQYEQQEAARMARASGVMRSGDFYINKPIPVQQRHRQ